MFILQSSNPEDCAYNQACCIKVVGSLRVSVFETSVRMVMNRCDSLRTSILGSNVMTSGDLQVQQLVAREGEVELRIAYHQPASGTEAEQLLRAAARAPFTLAEAPLFRVCVCAVCEQNVHLIGVTFHHSVIDGMSVNLILKQIAHFYNTLLRDPGPEQDLSQPPQLQYAAYAVWQRAVQLSPAALTELEDYWRKALPSCPILDMPTDRARPSRFGGVQGSVPIIVTPSSVRALTALAARHRCTLFQALLAAYGLLLCKLSNAAEVVVGFPYMNRDASPALETAIGYFVTTLPIVVRAEGTLAALLDRVCQAAVRAMQNAALPFSRIVSAVGADRDPSRTPLVQTMLTLYSREWFEAEAEGLRLDGVEVQDCSELVEGLDAKFELSIDLKETGAQSLEGNLNYLETLYDRSTAVAIAERFQQMLHGFACAGGDDPVQGVNWLRSQDKHMIDTLSRERPMTSDIEAETLVDVFHRTLNRVPTAIAVVSNKEELSYAELSARADALGRALMRRGVQPRQFVGLCVERSSAMMVGVLAILKCGGAYVPIEPDLPEQRATDIVNDSGMTTIVAQSGPCADLFKRCGRTVVVVDDPGECIDDGCAHSHIHQLASSNGNPSWPRTRSGDPCYMIFTSGSTGRPKGCVVQHGGVVHFIKTSLPLNDMQQSDRNFLSQSFAFDASVKIIWYALSTGSALVVPRKQEMLDDLPAAAARYRCTIVSGTPTLVAAQSEAALHRAGVRALFVCGEAVTEEFINRFAPRLRVVNGYGPTELCVNVTMVRCTVGMPHPRSIGRPLDGLRCYILDLQTRQRLPEGVPGELCVSGEQVTLGYHNRPDLTDQVFLANPFLSPHEGSSTQRRFARMYRTGDLCRWLPDGTIEYLGRIDKQIKLRGYRVEKGEIENKLQQVEGVTDAVVVLRQQTQTLVAYVVPATVDAASCRAHLQQVLPEYMVPATIVPLDSLPRTMTGKVDEKALLAREPARSAIPAGPRSLPLALEVDAVWAAPPAKVRPGAENERGENVLHVFRKVLQAPAMTAEDNLYELGMTSINAIAIANELRRQGLAEASVAAMIQHRTVASLCDAFGLQTAAQRVESNPPPEHMAEENSCSTTLDRARQHALNPALAQHDDTAEVMFAYRQGSLPCMALQALGHLILFVLVALSALPPIWFAYGAYRDNRALDPFAFAGCGVLGMAAVLATTVVLKWLLMGTQQRSDVPLWSWPYLRWWFVHNLIRMVEMLFLHRFRGTVVLTMWLRALGATVGANAVIHTLDITDHDLLTILDNVVVGEDAVLTGHYISDGMLCLRPVWISSTCSIGVGAHVGPLPWRQCVRIPESHVVPPLASASRCHRPLSMAAEGSRSRRLSLPLQALSLSVVFLLEAAAALPMLLLARLAALGSELLLILVVLGSGGLVCSCAIYMMLVVVLYRCSHALGHSFRRHVLGAAASSPLLRVLDLFAHTRVVPTYLSLLGATVGEGCLLTFPLGFCEYRQLRIGGGVLFGSHLHVTEAVGSKHRSGDVAVTSFGQRAVVTNHVVVEAGAAIQDDCTIGDRTFVDCVRTYASGTNTVGGVTFPRSRSADPGPDWSLSGTGGWWWLREVLLLVVRMAVIPTILLPALAILYACSSAVAGARTAVVLFPAWHRLKDAGQASAMDGVLAWTFVPVLLLAVGGVSGSVLLAFKWACVGRFAAETTTPFSSVRYQLWQLSGVMLGLADSLWLQYLKGSEWICVFCRLMGSQVAADVSFWADPFPEFDLFSLGYGAALGRRSVLQGHLVNQLHLAHKATALAPRATLYPASNLLSGATVEEGGSLEASSLLLSGEVVGAGQVWSGVPAYLTATQSRRDV